MAADDQQDPTEMSEARERYQRERDKRLRTDGLEQYRELKGDYAEFDRDPYVEPGFTRDPIIEETEVVIVGGGFAGMLTAINLLREGVTDFRMVEKAGDFGGTWYWNRYPGCMCDVESYTYLPLLEETGYMPTEKYASASEIFAYCQQLGRQFELYPHALFQTEIDSAEWDEGTLRWQVHTTRADRLSARFLVTAGGILHKAKLPGIPGIRDVRGPGVPHESLGLRLHRRRSARAHGEAEGQTGRNHRHRCHRGTGRAPARRDRRRAVRVPANTVSGGRTQQRTHRRRVVRGPRARMAGRAHPQLHGVGDRSTSRSETSSATGGPRSCGTTPSPQPTHPRLRQRWNDRTSRRCRRCGIGSSGSSRIRTPRRSSSPGTASTASGSASTTSTCRRSIVRTCTWSTPTAEAWRRSPPAACRRRRSRVPGGPADLRFGVRGHHRPRSPTRLRPQGPRRHRHERTLARRRAHTARCAVRASSPNMMMISLVQAGFGTNFLHFLARVRQARRLADRHLRTRTRRRPSRPRPRPRRSGWSCCTESPRGSPTTRRPAHPATTTGNRVSDPKSGPQPRVHRQPPGLCRIPGAMARRRRIPGCQSGRRRCQW